VGGNESAAFGSGIKVARVKFTAYVLSALLAALAGLYLSARTSSGDPNIGSSYTIYSISATVVGGTMMTGAVGQAYGTACGAVIIFLINNILNMLDVSAFYQYAIQGAVLIFALMVGSLETRRERA
jgi:ribose transport system permease protein